IFFSSPCARASALFPTRRSSDLNTELILADIDSIQKRRTKQQKAAKGGDKKAIAEIALLDRLEPHLNTGQFAFSMEIAPEEAARSEEHTSELQSRGQLVCRLLPE